MKAFPCLLFAALSACSLAPTYERPLAPVPDRYDEPALPSELKLTSGEDATLNDWRQHFNNPSLQKVIDAALAHNRDLKIAALRMEELSALYRIQRADRIPNISAKGTFFRGRQIDPSTGIGVTGNQYDASVGLTSFELDFFGRVKSLSDAALSQYLASEAGLRSARITLIAETANAYIRELSLAQQEQLAVDTLTSREDTLAIDARRLDAGVANLLEMKTSVMLVESARARIAEVRREREQNRNALRILVGSFEFTPETEGQGVESIQLPELHGGLSSDLLLRRPDIIQAEERLKAANANIGAARAAFFPSISMTSSIGSVSRDFDDLFQSSSEVWSFIPQINIPIFAGGRNKANLDAAHVRKDIAIVQYEQAIQNSFREVRDALVAHDLIKLQVDAQKAVRDADVERARLAQKRYERGVSSYLEYLDAQRSQFDSDQTYLRLHELRLNNDIGLYRALGGG